MTVQPETVSRLWDETHDLERLSAQRRSEVSPHFSGYAAGMRYVLNELGLEDDIQRALDRHRRSPSFGQGQFTADPDL